MIKDHLIELEEEAISVIRDTYANSENPIVLYSVGKDSSVLWTYLRKHFTQSTYPCLSIVAIGFMTTKTSKSVGSIGSNWVIYDLHMSYMPYETPFF